MLVLLLYSVTSVKTIKVATLSLTRHNALLASEWPIADKKLLLTIPFDTTSGLRFAHQRGMSTERLQFCYVAEKRNTFF